MSIWYSPYVKSHKKGDVAIHLGVVNPAVVVVTDWSFGRRYYNGRGVPLDMDDSSRKFVAHEDARRDGILVSSDISSMKREDLYHLGSPIVAGRVEEKALEEILEFLGKVEEGG